MSFKRGLCFCSGLLILFHRKLLRNEVFNARENVFKHHDYCLLAYLLLPALNVRRLELLFAKICLHLLKALLVNLDPYKSLEFELGILN